MKTRHGEIETYRKVCVIENGQITRMYWEHSEGNHAFSCEAVIKRWGSVFPPNTDFTDREFLAKRSFFPWNVIRDGVRETAP